VFEALLKVDSSPQALWGVTGKSSQAHIDVYQVCCDPFVCAFTFRFLQFIRGMQMLLPPSLSPSSPAVVAELADIFEQIDVRGMGTISWNDFSGFLVEAGASTSSLLTDHVICKVPCPVSSPQF